MSEHTCKDCIDFIDAYIDGELSGDMKERFETHLEKCPPCVDYLKSYERTVKACKHLHKPIRQDVCEQLPEGLVKAIMKAKAETPDDASRDLA